MIYLRSINLGSVEELSEFPFNLPLIRNLNRIEFTRPVTFFVGENGSGKSTMIEAIAAGIGSVAVGGEDLQTDATLHHARELGKRLNFSWKRRTHRGFFLRAEDFFNFSKRINSMNREFDEMVSVYEQELTGYALQLAKGAVLGQKQAFIERYGEDADARSHGESFLHLIKERFVPGGLYLLDEPEVPLSPQRQLSLLSILKEMVEDSEAQFIIATHSPIVMALPGALILNFDDGAVMETAYDDLEHVSLTRSFLKNPERFLRHL